MNSQATKAQGRSTATKIITCEGRFRAFVGAVSTAGRLKLRHIAGSSPLQLHSYVGLMLNDFFLTDCVLCHEYHQREEKAGIEGTRPLKRF
jgi:hypothetical protein